MHPITQFGMTLVGGWVFDRWQKSREEKAAAAKANALPPPLRFTPEQVNMFTRVVGASRAFDSDATTAILGLLKHRSVIQTEEPNLSPFGRVWRIVPLTNGLPRASDVVAHAHAMANQGVVVCGSHSLILLPNGSMAPMVLLIGGPPAAQVWCARGGMVSGTMIPPGIFAQLMPVVSAAQTASAAAEEVEGDARRPTEPAPAPVPPASAPAHSTSPTPAKQSFEELAAELTNVAKTAAPSKKNGKAAAHKEDAPIAPAASEPVPPVQE